MAYILILLLWRDFAYYCASSFCTHLIGITHKQKMNILFFTKGDRKVGSSRLRVWLIAEELQAKYGLHYEVFHSVHYSVFSFTVARFRIFSEIFSKIRDTQYKILFVHKSLYPWDVVLLILAGRFLLRKRLVYDLDDAEWEHSFLKTWLLTKSAHAVFCGSHPILEWVEKHTPHAFFIPTVVDAVLYKSFSVQHKKRQQVTIGWVGVGRGYFQDGHFGILKPALDELWRKGLSFRFVVLGAQNHQPLKDYFNEEAYETIFVDELDWAGRASVPRAIHEYQFDIGVMPILDTPFDRAKCAFKAIEYMACGVPSVASRVGEATYLIQEGKNGFLAGNTDEWMHALQRLIEDADLRGAMGKQAQETITLHYSYEHTISQIYEILNTQ